MVVFVLLFAIINLSQLYQTPNVSVCFPELLVKISFTFGKLWTFKPLCFQLPPVDFVKPLSGTLLAASYMRNVSVQQRHHCWNQPRTRSLLAWFLLLDEFWQQSIWIYWTSALVNGCKIQLQAFRVVQAHKSLEKKIAGESMTVRVIKIEKLCYAKCCLITVSNFKTAVIEDPLKYCSR